MCPSRELSDKSSDLWRPWEREKAVASRIAPMKNKILNNSSASPLQCQICYHQPFKRDSELRRHVNSKHSIKRERCPDCNKIFTRKDNLTRHQKMAHSEKSKPNCRFCQKRLSRRDAVQRHESRCPRNVTRELNRQLAPVPPEVPGCDTAPVSHIDRLKRKHPGLQILQKTTEKTEGIAEPSS